MLADARQTPTGFSLVETLVALMLCGAALTAFLTATTQAMRVARSAKETAFASQLLQQRMESFRTIRPWSKMLSPDFVDDLFANAELAAGNFSRAGETYSVSTYPNTSGSFSVARAANGTITRTGAPLPAAQRCVRIEGKVTWPGTDRRPRSRTASVILSKGGI